MPVKLGSQLPHETEARIEIVPLIDIMFFLLASFMLVSLSMVTLHSMKVTLPSAKTAQSDNQKHVADVSVDQNGGVYLDDKPIADHELVAALSERQHATADLHVFISGDKDARHGEMIHVLDLIRSAGIDKIAFQITPASPKEQAR